MFLITRYHDTHRISTYRYCDDATYKSTFYNWVPSKYKLITICQYFTQNLFCKFETNKYFYISNHNILIKKYKQKFKILNKYKLELKLEMWANAQPDGRPAEYR